MKLEHIVWKNLTVRKFKTFLMIVCVFLAVGSIFAIFKISTELEKNITKSFDEIGANIIVTPDYKNRDTLTADDIIKINSIKDKDNVAVIAPKLIKKLTVAGKQVPVAGVDFPYELKLNKKIWTLNGEKPEAVNDIIAGFNAARRLDIQTGGTLNIAGKDFKVKAILKPTGTSDDEVIFANLLTLQKLTGSMYKLNLIEVSAYCYTCPLPQITRQISDKLPNAKVYKVSDSLQTRQATVEKFSVYSKILAIFIVITISFLLFIINVSVVRERKKEFGILRTCGFRRIQIVEMLLTENMVKGLAGAVIGYLASVAFAKLWLENVDIFSVSTSFSVIELLVATAAAYLIVIISSMVPALQASGVDPLEVINE